jgi:Pyridoxamine 5'-phosphate oxidase
VSTAPRVRTVHLRYLEKPSLFAFGTHTSSAKWLELKKCEAISGCYFDTSGSRQFRWEGTARLIDGTEPSDDLILEEMWRRTRTDVRRAYWLKYLVRRASDNLSVDVGKRCPTFGGVVCLPVEWDLYEMSETDYAKDQRTIYRMVGGEWRHVNVSTLDGEPL